MAELGVNVSPGGEVSPGELAAAGARWARAPAWPEHDLRGWLTACRVAGVRTVLVLDQRSLTDDEDQWGAGLDLARDRYGELVDAWQIGNEPDAEPPSASGGSSWRMDQARLGRLLRLARERLGSASGGSGGSGAPQADTPRLIGPGLCSGRPDWLAEVDQSALGGLDALAYHPYGKHPDRSDWGTGPWRPLHEGYRAVAGGRPLWVTEFGIESLPPGEQADYYGVMLRALRGCATLAVGLVFCWSDAQVAGFGLCGAEGRRKPAYWAFVSASGGSGAAAQVSGGPETRGQRPETATTEGRSQVADFVLGFKELADRLGREVVGTPLEDEHDATRGNHPIRHQLTSKGELVYWKTVNRADFMAARTG